MLLMSDSLIKRPVISLRSGVASAIALEPIIDPTNMKIIGWWCQVPADKAQRILLAEDVREIMPEGLAIDDDADLSLPRDLVRHKEILRTKFQLIGKLVKTKHQKLGKVSDFSYDKDGMFVQKLYVARSLMKVFSGDDSLMVDRNQIIEVTDNYIMVEGTEIKASDEEDVMAADALPAA